ncbi:MAG: hypothetical protein V2A53_07165, partial [bacterium]
VATFAFKKAQDYTVKLTVKDTAGNEDVVTHTITVTDGEAPVISMINPPFGNTITTTGEEITIIVSVKDNIALGTDTLPVIWYAPAGAMSKKLILSLASVNMYLIATNTDQATYSATLATYSVTLKISGNYAGGIDYYIQAKDRAGNETRSPKDGNYTISVSDNDKPEVSQVRAGTYTEGTATAYNSQGNIQVSAKVVDNIPGVKSYLCWYNLDGVSNKVTMEINSQYTGTQTGGTATAAIPIPNNKVGSITYWIEAEDAAGDAARNGTRTQDYKISVVDDVKPEGEVVINSGTATTGTTSIRNVRLWISASDNIGVNKMRIKDSLGDTWSNWQGYVAGEVDWILGGSGATETTVTVTVEFKDKAGNIGSDTDTIFLDTKGPTEISVLINDDAYSLSMRTWAFEYKSIPSSQGATTLTLTHNPVLWVRGVWSSEKSEEKNERNYYTDIETKTTGFLSVSASVISVEENIIQRSGDVIRVYKPSDPSKSYYSSHNAKQGKIYLSEPISGTYTVDYVYDGFSKVKTCTEPINLSAGSKTFYTSHATILKVTKVSTATGSVDYYKGGSYDVKTGEVTLSTVVPSTDIYYITYDYFGLSYNSQSNVVNLGTPIPETSTYYISYVCGNPDSAYVVSVKLGAEDAATYQIMSDNGFSENNKWIPFVGTKTMDSTFTLTIGDEVKEVYARFRDKNGNISEIKSDKIRLDTLAPDPQITINENKEITNEATVTLSLLADITARYIFIANWKGEEVDPFAENVKVGFIKGFDEGWVLYKPEIDGIKKVQAKFWDMNLNESVVVQDTIIYRRNPEVSTRTIVGSGTIGYTDIGSRSLVCRLDIPAGVVSGTFTGTVTPVASLGFGVEFTGWDITPSPMPFNSPCTLTIGYSDLNNDGYVDGTDITEAELVVSWYDESREGWVNLGGKVDTVRNCVTVQITHLSRFVLASKNASSLPSIASSVLLGNLMLEYNPYDPVDDRDNPLGNPFQFDLGRPANVTIKVYDTVGDLVSTVADEKYCAGNARESIGWNGKTNGGSYLKPGLYVFQIQVKAQDNGETRLKTGGICIVR